MTNPVDKALGLRTLPAAIDAEEKLPVPASDDQVSDDLDQARDGLYDALDKSQQVVDDLLLIARQSQHPKAYEILNSAIKTMADVSMGLADLQLKKQRLDKQRTNDTPESQTVNNLFVGSTAELQQMLDNMRKGDS